MKLKTKINHSQKHRIFFLGDPNFLSYTQELPPKQKVAINIKNNLNVDKISQYDNTDENDIFYKYYWRLKNSKLSENALSRLSFT